jgi:hypothetical protein
MRLRRILPGDPQAGAEMDSPEPEDNERSARGVKRSVELLSTGCAE